MVVVWSTTTSSCNEFRLLNTRVAAPTSSGGGGWSQRLSQDTELALVAALCQAYRCSDLSGCTTRRMPFCAASDNAEAVRVRQEQAQMPHRTFCSTWHEALVGQLTSML